MLKTPVQRARWGRTARTTMWALLTTSALVMPPLAAQADNGDNDASAEPTELDVISVEGETESPYGPVESYVPDRTMTGTKTNTVIDNVPQSISIIPRERLDKQGADSVSDVFRYTPGVKGEANGNDTRVDFLRFRGFNDNGNAQFRDTLQLRSSGFGQFKPELYGVQRVEVLRGPASMLFGQGNPGGLVNFVTKRPTTETFAEAQVEIGNFQHREVKADLGGAVPGTNENVAVRLTALGRDSDTQVDFVDNDRLYLAPAVTVQPTEDTTFTLLSHYQEDDTGSTNQFLPAQGTIQNNPNGDLDPDTFVGNPDFDDFNREVFSIGYSLEHAFNDSLTLRQNVRYNNLESDSQSVFGGGLQADQRTLNRFSFKTNDEVEGISIDTNAEAKFTTGPAEHTFLAGVGYQSYEFEEIQGFGSAPTLDIFNPNFSGGTPAAPTFQDNTTEQDQIGIYAQDQITLYDRVVVTLGGRHDWADSEIENNLAGTITEQNDSEFTGRAGVVYRSRFGISPYVSYATSFLPETGTDAQGDPFEPTTSEQWEGGIRYRPEAIDARFSLAAFNLVRENVTTTDPNNPNNDVQTGEVRSRGFEFEGNVSLDRGLNLSAAYTFQDVEKTQDNDGFEGKRPRQVPEHEASIWVDYTVQSGALKGLGIGTGVRYKGSTFADNANTVEVDGFTLVDASISYEWRSFEVSVRGENVLGNEHVASCTSTNACFFGSERRVFANVTYRW